MIEIMNEWSYSFLIINSEAVETNEAEAEKDVTALEATAQREQESCSSKKWILLFQNVWSLFEHVYSFDFCTSEYKRYTRICQIRLFLSILTIA
jgi:hypothetical protein